MLKKAYFHPPTQDAPLPELCSRIVQILNVACGGRVEWMAFLSILRNVGIYRLTQLLKAES